MFPITTQPHLVHAIFEAIALSAGVTYYRWRLSRSNNHSLSLLGGKGYFVILGCICGAAIGNKVVFWAEVPNYLTLYWNKPAILFAGQSMVGGLLGGLLGIELAKNIIGVTQSTGDNFVYPILLGLIIGRIGCFVAGLADGTYGLPSSLPWAVNFGDGIPRHPTQLYEILFALFMWILLKTFQTRWQSQPGLLFKILLSSYLCWRLVIDSLKPNPFDYGLGLSGIQLVCILALIIYLPTTLKHLQLARS